MATVWEEFTAAVEECIRRWAEAEGGPVPETQQEQQQQPAAEPLLHTTSGIGAGGLFVLPFVIAHDILDMK